ncbi:MAG TPA: DNA polymerase III subunit beta [Salinivirga sp.]|uniref:Beta sliding clamp n=1 Tax=Salinivirga cyanobacteriivorans TaxID=1307839 RepID=A0A0S2I1Q7_9BACT|nr:MULTISPECIES: DNA polymerase III subunit beta [Salinivirga]ALO16273.1 DNA polymerase III subunit beta [Salinivirga cyanobacteriivorans]HKK58099.1 DNA polymerase III subunit beta [Salinivirga sp.]
MNFVVSSTDLLNHLQAIAKVISSKNTLPILDNFLFELKGNVLTITASDLETTLVTSMEVDNAEGEGVIAVDARRLLKLKDTSEQPLTFNINTESLSVDILSESGKFTKVEQKGEDYPKHQEIDDAQKTEITLKSEALLSAINKTIFATAEDDLRPVMNGILFAFSPDYLTAVASDAHKMVRYRRLDVKADQEASFILPQKPAQMLKNLLPNDETEVKVTFDQQNAIIEFGNFLQVCRLVEGKYPNYEAVIPKDNPYKMTVDRLDLHNKLKMVSGYANPASNLVKLSVAPNELKVSAQDLDFSMSAFERLKCEYEGQEMEIGFKALFMIEIVANISSPDIFIELSDPSRAALFLPVEKEDENEDLLMLLMPMMVNQ